MLAGLADVVVEVLAGRARHSLMPGTADPEAIRLHGVVASAIQGGDGATADDAMRAIVTESATAIHAMHASTKPEPKEGSKIPLPSVLTGSV